MSALLPYIRLLRSLVIDRPFRLQSLQAPALGSLLLHLYTAEVLNFIEENKKLRISISCALTLHCNSLSTDIRKAEFLTKQFYSLTKQLTV